MNTLIKLATDHWRYVAPLLTRPACETHFQTKVSALDELLDIVGDDENHPLMGLIEHLGNLVSAYEQTHHPMPPSAD